MHNQIPGQIFTFYSYKGGTGRSMALANVGCLLAQKWSNNQDVLLIDWDLEAPGLHKFFESHLSQKNKKNRNDQPGLIDMFVRMKELCANNSFDGDVPRGFFEDVLIEKFILKTNVKNLFLMPAGKFDGLFSTRVNSFNWEEFFNKNPRLISGFANYLAKKFKYILIDSRTGYTDISNVCTALMPEKLIVVFTPNRQSLDGVIGMVESASEYRKKSDDLRPLVVFPLPSRIENAERELQKDWRIGNAQKKINGYQLQFESLFQKIYKLPKLKLDDYFDDIRIQYVPWYSYGEEIAVLLDRSEDRLSISRSYEDFAEALVSLDAPWEYAIESSINITGNVNVSNIYISGNQKTDTVGNGDKVNVRFSEKKLRVFLSHASSDKGMVRELYQRLLAEGWIDPWLDEEKLLPGQDWVMEINKAVDVAHVVIVCLSNRSVTKEGYVQKELEITLRATLEKTDGNIFILPLRLDDCEIPRSIQMWQYADYFPESRRDAVYQKLLASLRIRMDSLS